MYMNVCPYSKGNSKRHRLPAITAGKRRLARNQYGKDKGEADQHGNQDQHDDKRDFHCHPFLSNGWWKGTSFSFSMQT